MMARILRLTMASEPAVYHVISRTAHRRRECATVCGGVLSCDDFTSKYKDEV